MSRLEEQKGHAYLLAALPKLIQEIDDLVVLIAGEGRLRDRLLEQARDLGVEKQVRFLGNRRDVPEIQRALDIFVQPSLWEGLPLALLKAMGAGLPVVATRVSGCMDAVMDGGNGRLVEPADAEALAQVILELYRHPEERRRLGEAARCTVEDRFSFEAMLKRIEGLYLELWRMAIRNNKSGG
jgi:glycosyltransferase involved in cell wall biosynthesis